MQIRRRLTTLFNKTFPLPQQASWAVFRLSTKVTMRVISALQMQGTMLAKWQRLPKIGRHVEQIGPAMSGLWDWTLLYRGSTTRPECVPSQGSPHASDKDTSAGASML
jgi:hypothetical protein